MEDQLEVRCCAFVDSSPRPPPQSVFRIGGLLCRSSRAQVTGEVPFAGKGKGLSWGPPPLPSKREKPFSVQPPSQRE